MSWNELKMQILAMPAIVLALVSGLAAAPAAAEKPFWGGNGGEILAKSGEKEEKAKSSKNEKKEKKTRKKHAKSKKSEHGEHGKHDEHGKHFRDQDKDVVRNYYRKEFREGKDCPPGLAKKDNGCMPPGQAKKQWSTGEPLRRDVVHHHLPRELLAQLPPPPHGQRYVRVVSDILLVGLDTDVVIDAIVDLAIP